MVRARRIENARSSSSKRPYARLPTGRSGGAELLAARLPARWQALRRRAGKGAAGSQAAPGPKRLSAALQGFSIRPDASGCVW